MGGALTSWERLTPGRTTEAAQDHALLVEGVFKRWQTHASAVLTGVDLRVDTGSSVAVTGSNGAGKTTLLRIAAGLIDADAGSVTVYGVNPADRREFHRRIGFAGAGGGGLYGRLRVEDHLSLASRLALMPRRERAAAVDAAIRRFSLAPLCGRRVDRLSTGERQRLRLALAFVHQPSLVLLDEPTTSLDEDGVAILQAALDDLAERGGAAVVCLPTGWERSLALDRCHALSEGKLG